MKVADDRMAGQYSISAMDAGGTKRRPPGATVRGVLFASRSVPMTCSRRLARHEWYSPPPTRNHDTADNAAANLAAFCQRCHMVHDRPEHQRRRWLTLFQRKALGDLFRGPYR